MPLERIAYFTMPDRPPLPAGHALLRWIIYVLGFILAGGVASGLTALGYEWLMQAEYSRELYAIIFAASGYIAYRLMERVMASSASP